jgi:ribonucleoside-diphosphate reductase beta chain
MRAVGFKNVFPTVTNPLPWMNAWLVSDSVQVAPQEAEISSYLVGAIDNEVSDEDFSDFSL